MNGVVYYWMYWPVGRESTAHHARNLTFSVSPFDCRILSCWTGLGWSGLAKRKTARMNASGLSWRLCLRACSECCCCKTRNSILRMDLAIVVVIYFCWRWWWWCCCCVVIWNHSYCSRSSSCSRSNSRSDYPYPSYGGVSAVHQNRPQNRLLLFRAA